MGRTYSVAVEKTGFKKVVWESIEVHAQDRVRADFQLQLGQINESVSVSAEAPLLQSESSTVAHVVEQREIRELPAADLDIEKTDGRSRAARRRAPLFFRPN